MHKRIKHIISGAMFFGANWFKLMEIYFHFDDFSRLFLFCQEKYCSTAPNFTNFNQTYWHTQLNDIYVIAELN